MIEKPKYFGAGILKHQITIQKRIGSINNYGEIDDNWSDYYTLRANVCPLSGSETKDNKKLNEIEYQIIIRSQPAGVLNITPDMRIKYLDRTISIESIIDDPDHEFMVINGKYKYDGENR